jgi:signal transduction histidine kinase
MTMISPTDQPARKVAPAPAALWPSESAEDRLCALAHELRGGLHILTLNTNLMLDRTRTDDEGVSSTWLADRLRRQADGLRSMLELIERLLDEQITEHSSEVRTLRLVDLRALVFDILQSDSESLQAARCMCSLQAPCMVSGYWDALQLRVAISNLIGNAIKFGPGKPVEISVGCKDDVAYVRVTDHGPGVRPEDKDRIFERFERASGGVRGAGLGLWLVRGIARAHGGEVTVSSMPGLGATFTFSVPGAVADLRSASQR